MVVILSVRFDRRALQGTRIILCIRFVGGREEVQRLN